MTGRGSSHTEHRNVEKGLSNVQCEHLHMFAAILKKIYAAVRLERSTTKNRAGGVCHQRGAGKNEQTNRNLI